ncbi:hypothetical protein EV356DRAFT_520917 [Viridothelium virens]|uniref:2EXR domain-containing protein n=1 Tax=Viridothelium virens TaxID=1048519 RepID=A0A6A6HJG3_VIRVR|nr:hypothetical protein EV356DRAFT_520917 [Viridothelium virens]
MPFLSRPLSLTESDLSSILPTDSQYQSFEMPFLSRPLSHHAFPPFSSLPPELRLEIYDLVFADIHVSADVDPDQKRTASWRTSSFRPHRTAILTTCRQIYEEASEIFRSSVNYCLEVHHEDGFRFRGVHVPKWEKSPDAVLESLRATKRLRLCFGFGHLMTLNDTYYYRELLYFIIEQLQQPPSITHLTICPYREIAPMQIRDHFFRDPCFGVSYIEHILRIAQPLRDVTGIKSVTLEPVNLWRYPDSTNPEWFMFELATDLDRYLRTSPFEYALRSQHRQDRLYGIDHTYQILHSLVYPELNSWGQVRFDSCSDEFLRYRWASLYSGEACYPIKENIQKMRNL